MVEAMKPCPFCGSQYVKLSSDADFNNSWTIRCPRCHMIYIPDAQTKDLALEMWNKRA